MTEAAIDNRLFRHLYVSLGEPIGDAAWGVRIYIKPFVSWIWAGCFLMALGGLLALSDKRYRLKAKVTESARPPGPQVAGPAQVGPGASPITVSS
jgi:cytochrome c-type biogenesis protein CcmF